MSYKIIVSRYYENLQWLEKEIDNCLIYNKGIFLNIKNEILLNNVGRESETYLNYIINNYDNLPDVVVFTQGKIDDHMYENKDDYKNNSVDFLIKIKNEALLNGKSYPYIHYENDKESSCWDSDWNYVCDKKNSFYRR